MAIIHFINRPRSQTSKGMFFVLRYTMQNKKTVDEQGRKFVTGVNCTPASAHTEFMNTKKLYRKTDGRMYYHFVQSFSVGEDISPEKAHEIALRFASETEKFKDFEIVVSTHIDRDHIHSHFVLNSVNAQTGKKFHISKNEVDQLMHESDKLCTEYQLPVLQPKPKSKRTKSMSDREYRIAAKGQSWKIQLEAVISNAMQYAVSKEHFIELMELEGYQVKWTAERKNITYTTPDGQRCRDNKLHLEKFLKENMEDEFNIREKISAGNDRSGTADDPVGEYGTALRGGYGAELESHDPDTESADRFTVGAAENADRGLIRDQGGIGDSGHEGRDRGLSETTAGRTEAVHGEYQPNDNGISESNEGGGRQDTLGTGNSGGGDGNTGWEAEREIFRQSLIRAETDEPAYENPVWDRGDSFHPTADLAMDALSLAASLSRIIDDRKPRKDCTTMKKPKRQRKNGQIQGPGM